MRGALLGLAAAAAVAAGPAPAAAQEMTSFSPGFASVNSGNVGVRWDNHRRGDRHHRKRHRPRGDIVVPWGWDDGAWAYYNNRSWRSDSYNDWWHDRPDRAFPRWMQNNQNCERMWSSGGGWRC